MKIIITGSTGMVGRSVLNECLKNRNVKKVVLINRHSVGLYHPKLTEIIHADLADILPIKSQLVGLDACFYCVGITSVGLSEAEYYRITYEITESFAETMYELNPNMVFNYVSGTGTDSSEKGRIAWARTKGKAENMLFGKGFKDVYAFRPGFIIPEDGIKSRTPLYNFFIALFRPAFPLLKKLSSVTTSSKLGKAMINAVLFPQELKHLENKDINKLSEK